MLLIFFVVLLFGICQRRQIFELFHCWYLIPYFILELCYLIVQTLTLCGDYSFIPYATVIKRLYFVVLLFPILAQKLFVPAIAGAGTAFLGSALNGAVIHMNGGKMPVFPSFSLWTGYFVPDFEMVGDTLHTLGDASSRLPFLSDFIDLGYCILSVGDLLVHSFAFFVLYALMRKVCPPIPAKPKKRGKDASVSHQPDTN